MITAPMDKFVPRRDKFFRRESGIVPKLKATAF